MTEQLSSKLSDERAKRYIDTLPLDSPELHYLFNFLDHTLISDASGQNAMLRNAQEKYGSENVRVSLPVIEGKHVPTPDTYGIYVFAERWTELNPPQETTEQPSLGA